MTKKQGDYFILDSKNLKHLKVVRIKNEQIICVYKEKFYICKQEANRAKIVKPYNLINEYKGTLALAISIIDKKRFAWLIEKATELGVQTIIPVTSTNVSQNVDLFKKKLNRFKLILEAAAQQSFRNCVPKILEPKPFEDVVNLEVKNKFIAHELSSGVKSALTFPTDSLFLIGPAGGFTNNEIAHATSKGFQVVNLGPRILRSETAAICLLSRVNEER